MSDDENDNDRQEEEESESSKLAKPQSISRMFGKLSNIKFLQTSCKLKLGHKDSTLQLKGNQNKKNGPYVEFIKAKFEMRNKGDKVTLSFNPFSHKKQLQFGYKTSYDRSKIEFNFDQKNEGKFKFSYAMDFYEKLVKVNLDYFLKFKKSTLNHQYACDLTVRYPHTSVGFWNNYLWKQEELIKIKKSQKLQLKFETNTVIAKNDKQSNEKQKEEKEVEEQNENEDEFKRFKKKNDVLKLNSEHKLNTKADKKWEYKFGMGVEQNYRQVFRTDITYEDEKVSKWDVKYLLKNVLKSKFGFCYGNKGFQFIWEKNKVYKDTNLNVSVGKTSLGMKIGGKFNRKIKYEFAVQRFFDSQKINTGVYLSANY